MAKKGRNLMGGRNPKRKKAIDEAVGSAMTMPMKRPKARPATGMTSSPRPKARPPMPTPEEIGAAERGNRATKRRADEAMPMMKAGGMMKKKGYAKGGMMKKGYAKGGKVRGAGRASKGVRPAKMVTMKGS